MHKELISIDSVKTRDIDDAFWVGKTETGYVVQVAIANPAALVPIGSQVDQRARLQALTHYRQGGAWKRMLPESVSENASSLIAGKCRQALVFDLALDVDLEVSAFSLAASEVKVSHRVDYETIPALLADGGSPAHETLVLVSALAEGLLQKRRNKGALAIFDLRKMLLTDEEGNLIRCSSREQVIGQIIVQELMILTNHCAAKFAVQHEIPVLFRNHQTKPAAPTAMELAQTVQAWIAGGCDQSSVAQIVGALSKGQYGARLTGHYGLNLPFYLHATSPLRRYADLVNIRQLIAYSEKKDFCYSQEDLEALADELNATIARQGEESSERYKAAVRAKARKAMDNGALERLTDSELRQAAKFGKIDPHLSAEIVRRFKNGSISDALADSLFTEVEPNEVTGEAKDALVSWLLAISGKSMHMLMHAQQTGFVHNVNFDSEDDAGAFAASVSVTTKDGSVVVGNGTGGRKQEATQLAAADVIAKILGVDAAIPAKELLTVPTVCGNPKGDLLEFCQKNRWPAPVFNSRAEGASHAPAFSATITIEIGAVGYCSESSGCATKKEAEAKCAENLLKQIRSLKQDAPAQARWDNPVGSLQELMQQRKQQLPAYSFEGYTTGGTVSFSCSVEIGWQGKTYRREAVGSSKQEAKKEAAMLALALVAAS